jgi:hypothetical protein
MMIYKKTNVYLRKLFCKSRFILSVFQILLNNLIKIILLISVWLRILCLFTLVKKAKKIIALFNWIANSCRVTFIKIVMKESLNSSCLLIIWRILSISITDLVSKQNCEYLVLANQLCELTLIGLKKNLYKESVIPSI